MPLLALAALRAVSQDDSGKPLILAVQFDLSIYSFVERRVAREFIIFLMRVVAARTQTGERNSIEHQGLVAFVYKAVDGLTFASVAGIDYPRRVAFGILTSAEKQLRETFEPSVWQALQKDFGLPFSKQLKELIAKNKDPLKCDELEAVYGKAEHAKEKLHQSLTTILRNSEDLAVLVSQSEDLSGNENYTDGAGSKSAFKSSKKLKNKQKCCRIQ